MIFRKAPHLVEIEANISWLVAKDTDSNTWIAVCPALNLNALGDTYSELLESAEDAMDALFTDLFEEGELDLFLRQNGWRVVDGLPEKGQKARFDVPFEMRRANRVEELTATA